MYDKPKIKIVDNPELRKELFELVQKTNQIDLSNWAMNCSKHILNLIETEKIDLEIVNNWFSVVKLWQDNKSTINDIRQTGFKIHRLARNCKTEISKNILRTIGQAVSVCHMKEHAIVCSDYAIKTIQLVFDNNIRNITNERIWQIQELNKIKQITNF